MRDPGPLLSEVGNFGNWIPSMSIRSSPTTSFAIHAWCCMKGCCLSGVGWSGWPCVASSESCGGGLCACTFFSASISLESPFVGSISWCGSSEFARSTSCSNSVGGDFCASALGGSAVVLGPGLIVGWGSSSCCSGGTRCSGEVGSCTCACVWMFLSRCSFFLPYRSFLGQCLTWCSWERQRPHWFGSPLNSSAYSREPSPSSLGSTIVGACASLSLGVVSWGQTVWLCMHRICL